VIEAAFAVVAAVEVEEAAYHRMVRGRDPSEVSYPDVAVMVDGSHAVAVAAVVGSRDLKIVGVVDAYAVGRYRNSAVDSVG
jgi:hypothetical protein